jgi:hypothetical protein
MGCKSADICQQIRDGSGLLSIRAKKPWTFWRVVRWSIGAALTWCLIVVIGVLIAYGRGYWNEGGGRDASFALDLRQDRNTPGQVVELVTRRAEPDEGLIIGHTWAVWPQDPPHAGQGGLPPGWGYYAEPFWPGAAAVARNMFNPLGLITGMKPVPGHLTAETWALPQMRLVLTLDAAGYARVRAVHERWLAETRYSVRPGLYSPRVACQDYVYDLAQAAGLKVPARHWMEFPYTSYLRLLAANGIDVG